MYDKNSSLPLMLPIVYLCVDPLTVRISTEHTFYGFWCILSVISSESSLLDNTDVIPELKKKEFQGS